MTAASASPEILPAMAISMLLEGAGDARLSMVFHHAGECGRTRLNAG
jgi:hypothetical protein